MISCAVNREQSYLEERDESIEKWNEFLNVMRQYLLVYLYDIIKFCFLHGRSVFSMTIDDASK